MFCCFCSGMWICFVCCSLLLSWCFCFWCFCFVVVVFYSSSLSSSSSSSASFCIFLLIISLMITIIIIIIMIATMITSFHPSIHLSIPHHHLFICLIASRCIFFPQLSPPFVSPLSVEADPRIGAEASKGRGDLKPHDLGLRWCLICFCYRLFNSPSFRVSLAPVGRCWYVSIGFCFLGDV